MAWWKHRVVDEADCSRPSEDCDDLHTALQPLFSLYAVAVAAVITRVCFLCGVLLVASEPVRRALVLHRPVNLVIAVWVLALCLDVAMVLSVVWRTADTMGSVANVADRLFPDSYNDPEYAMVGLKAFACALLVAIDATMLALSTKAKKTTIVPI